MTVEFEILHRRGTLVGTQYRKTVRRNWQIPQYRVENRQNTDTAFMIGHAYLKLYPSRVFVYLKQVIHQKSTSAIARKRVKTSN